MPLDKTKLGTRYTCFSCGTRFYDLNRPVATCPECGADQAEAPATDVKAMISRSKKKAAPKPEPKPAAESSESSEFDEDDELDDGIDDLDGEEDDELDELGDENE